MVPLLIDTCTAIWFVNGEAVSAVAVAAVDEALGSDVPILVSPISAWEVGMLVAKRRLSLFITPERWFARLLALPGIELAELSPDVLIAANFLPGNPPRDPSDRIIAATARDLGATLVTRDKLLLAYGQQGHMRVLEC